jgi:hypothetical protein
MKRFAIAFALAGFLFVSCASKPANPYGVAKTDFSDLTIDKRLTLVEVDEKKATGHSFFRSLFAAYLLSDTHMRLPPGIHTFRVKYRDGSLHSTVPVSVRGDFGSKKSYVLRGTVIQNSWVEVNFYEELPDGKKVKMAPEKIAKGN